MNGTEFTFTFSPTSSLRFTPSSSQDGSAGSASPDSQQSAAASPTPRASPSTSDLFQNLNISSISTYADQHNATPGPRPKHVKASRRSPLPRGLRSAPASYKTGLNGKGLFSAYREPVAQSTSPGYGTERPLTPATRVEEDENLLDGGPPTRTSVHVEDDAYNFRQEPLPPAPIYNCRLQDGLKDVKNQLGDLANTMRLSELVRDPNTSLHTLYEETKKASEFKYPETRTVGFIGDSGVGMLSFIAWLSKI